MRIWIPLAAVLSATLACSGASEKSSGSSPASTFGKTSPNRSSQTDAGGMGDMPGMDMDGGMAGMGDVPGMDMDASAPTHDGGMTMPMPDAAPPPPPPPPIGPGCDTDNPVSGSAGGIDVALPDAIVQFERHGGWNCTHRKYHDERRWNWMMGNESNFAGELSFAESQGWSASALQEGSPGAGQNFLAMHRSMVQTLRTQFPANASLFAGWSQIPTSATQLDPLPPGAGAYNSNMLNALSNLENNSNLAAFASDDDLGNYIDTQLRPTAGNPLGVSNDPTVGLHAYEHERYDDPRSPIRMERFSRNIENQTFWQLHGWIDNTWATWRSLHGLSNTTDTNYVNLMNNACMMMGFMMWNESEHTCMQ